MTQIGDEFRRLADEARGHPENTPEKIAARKIEFDRMMEARAKIILTKEERDAALRVVQRVHGGEGCPKPGDSNYLEWVVIWACNGIDFYREEKATGAKSYIVVSGPAPIGES